MLLERKKMVYHSKEENSRMVLHTHYIMVWHKLTIDWRKIQAFC